MPTGFGFGEDGEKENAGDEDLRVIYRHYATLYFVFVVDQSESELGILDLIQVFVESLDRCFENVCELDLIFHFDDVSFSLFLQEGRVADGFDQVHALLACIITGGLVLETSIDSIATTFANQKKAKANSNASYSTPFSNTSTASVLGGLGSMGGAISVMKGLAEGGVDRLGIGSKRGR